MKWFIGDLHFGHEKLLATQTWSRFSSIEEHDNYIIEKWNELITEEDSVFILGDVAVAGANKEQAFSKVLQLKGRKTIVLGNHDHFYPNLFQKIFEDRVYGCYWLKNQNWILTHIPIHPAQLENRFSANIHGHLHTQKINDPRYMNVSCEQIEFTPISLDQIREYLG